MIVMRCRIIVNNVEYQGREGKPTTEAKKLNFFISKFVNNGVSPCLMLSPVLLEVTRTLAPISSAKSVVLW